jgi:integrase/recombinase XerD
MSSSVKDQFIDHMKLNELAENTKRSYLRSVKGLAEHYNCSPDLLTKYQVTLYFRHLILNKKLSLESCNNYLTGITYFYKNICQWEDIERFGVSTRRRKRKLPEVLSIEETQRLFSVITNLKHKVLLKTAYSAGLRVSEVISLKPDQIESDPSRMLIRVKQGKGRKDRYTLLSKSLLKELRAYWRQYQPEGWLFPGRKKGEHLTYAAARKIFVTNKKKPA